MVPIASFFSVGFGTIVFLNSERDIRYVVNKIAASTLHSMEHEIAELLNRRSSLDELQWKRLEVLTSLHQRIATSSYRTALRSGLSVFIPFVGPVVSAVWPKLKS